MLINKKERWNWHLAQGAWPHKQCVRQIKMLVPGDHQGHLRRPSCFLINIAQLLPHSTITTSPWGIWQAEVTLKVEGEKDSKANHKNCFIPTGVVIGWLGTAEDGELLFQGASWGFKRAFDCLLSPLPPLYPIFSPICWFPNIKEYEKKEAFQIDEAKK